MLSPELGLLPVLLFLINGPQPGCQMLSRKGGRSLIPGRPWGRSSCRPWGPAHFLPLSCRFLGRKWSQVTHRASHVTVDAGGPGESVALPKPLKKHQAPCPSAYLRQAFQPRGQCARGSENAHSEVTQLGLSLVLARRGEGCCQWSVQTNCAPGPKAVPVPGWDRPRSSLLCPRKECVRHRS